MKISTAVYDFSYTAGLERKMRNNLVVFRSNSHAEIKDLSHSCVLNVCNYDHINTVILEIGNFTTYAIT